MLYNIDGDIMMEKTIELLKNRDIVIPYVLFANYQTLKLNEEELIVITCLLNSKSDIYNPKEIAMVLKRNTSYVLEVINGLINKGFLEIKVEVEDNVHTEYVRLDNLYNRLGFLIVNSEREEKDSSNLYDCFEKEFGRPLSPIEFELIGGWQTTGTNEELILLALKEAVYNGALNIRYIDKILFEWSKKGIKTVNDVMNIKKDFRNKKEPTKVFDYDWLNEK